jgi:acyl-CoA hydrolase
MAKIIEREITSLRQVFPEHCNPKMPQMFGGALYSMMDELAHTLVLLNLKKTPCDNAVTHIWDGKFTGEPNLGDILSIRARVMEVRTKAIKVYVGVSAIASDQSYVKRVANANFVFCTKYGIFFRPHGLEMDMHDEAKESLLEEVKQ